MEWLICLNGFCCGILIIVLIIILQEGLEDIKLAHAEQLTQMRLPDVSIKLKSINESQSIIIRKRKHRCESTLPTKLGLSYKSVWTFWFDLASVKSSTSPNVMHTYLWIHRFRNVLIQIYAYLLVNKFPPKIVLVNKH